MKIDDMLGLKIDNVRANNRKRVFEVTTRKGTLPLPYGKVEPEPTSEDPIVSLFVDPELARQGFTWILKSGAEGSVPYDAVLDYNEDPDYMRFLLLYQLTVAAQDALKTSPLSTREIIRRAKTSPAQFYRLMDQTNYRKTVDSMLNLLAALDLQVDMTVRPRVHTADMRGFLAGIDTTVVREDDRV